MLQNQPIKALIRLSRWKERIPFTVPLTLLPQGRVIVRSDDVFPPYTLQAIIHEDASVELAEAIFQDTKVALAAPVGK